MSSLPTPKLVDLDDPLAPRREPARSAPPTSQPAPTAPAPAQAPRSSAPTRPAARRPARRPRENAESAPRTSSSLADEPLVAVFARMPESLSDRLADGVRELNVGRPRRSRISQQEVLGALVEKYVTPGDSKALAELVDAYRARTRR
jgi:hypothetical protein